ncbi:MAG: hypothetical protein GQ578_06380 [Desulfuromonadaceae bacterium]|nr:hypothetical protein [Desulfuromonadaceae bacterium]
MSDDGIAISICLTLFFVGLFVWYTVESSKKQTRKIIRTLPHLQIESRQLTAAVTVYSIIEIDQEDGYQFTPASTTDRSVADQWAEKLGLEIEPHEVVQAKIRTFK